MSKVVTVIILRVRLVYDGEEWDSIVSASRDAVERRREHLLRDSEWTADLIWPTDREIIVIGRGPEFAAIGQALGGLAELGGHISELEAKEMPSFLADSPLAWADFAGYPLGGDHPTPDVDVSISAPEAVIRPRTRCPGCGAPEPPHCDKCPWR